MKYVSSWERMAKADEKRAISLNMLKDNLPLEQIARLTGMSIAEVQALQAQADSQN